MKILLQFIYCTSSSLVHLTNILVTKANFMFFLHIVWALETRKNVWQVFKSEVNHFHILFLGCLLFYKNSTSLFTEISTYIVVSYWLLAIQRTFHSSSTKLNIWIPANSPLKYFNTIVAVKISRTIQQSWQLDVFQRGEEAQELLFELDHGLLCLLWTYNFILDADF